MDIKTLTTKIKNISDMYMKHYGLQPDGNLLMLKIQEEIGELTQSYLMMSGQARKKGKTEADLKKEFQDEIADAICHLLLIADFYGIDVEQAIEKKWLVWEKK